MASEEVLVTEYKRVLKRECKVNNELNDHRKELKEAKAAVTEKSQLVKKKEEERKETILEKFWRAQSPTLCSKHQAPSNKLP